MASAQTDTLSYTNEKDTMISSSIQADFLSPNGLDTNVKYDAEDSIIFYKEANQIILYGNAQISYGTFKLDNADKIVVYLDRDEVRAEYLPERHLHREQVDSLAAKEKDSLVSKNPLQKPGIPRVTDGSNTFEAKSMRYNYNTQKGIVYKAVTKQQNLFIHGGRTKIIQKDTSDIIYAQNTLITTCNAEHPHFGIRSTKQKVVPGKEVIIGPSNIEIAGVPTPLWLPFGFFPITTTAKRGLIIPTGYEYSPQNGFGIADIGYYTPLGPYADLKVLTEIYFRGRWGVSALSNYRKRYKFSGNINLSYLSQTISQNEFESEVRSFRFVWSHSMDRAAHPYTNFSANVNFSTNQFDRYNSTDANNKTNNNAVSNISFRRTFPNSPFSLNGAVNTSQNLNQRTIRMTLPRLSARMRVIYPFKRKKVVGKQRWYEGISLNYSGELQNNISATDSTIFQAKPWKEALFGARHTLTSNVAFKIFKYLNFSPSINYTETWHNTQLNQRFDQSLEVDTFYNSDSTQIEIDTSYGFLVSDTAFRLGRSSTINFSVGLNTKIFGTWVRNKGWLRGLRHVMTPSISLNYRPSNVNNDRLFGSYDEVLGPDETRTIDYARFTIGPYRGPSRSTGNLNISYSLNNLFEAKFASKKDTTDRKVTLLNALNFGGNVDLNRDSLHFSMLRYNASTTIIRSVMSLIINGQYDYYATNDEGNRIQKFYFEETGRPLRFERLNVTLNTNFTLGQALELFAPKTTSSQNRSLNQRNRNNEEGRLFDNFNIRHVIAFGIEAHDDGRKGASGQLRTNNLSFSGSLDLTKKWRLGIGNFGYDFVRRRLSYPSFHLTRDLHCWEFTFGWQPTGGTYSFNIYVKDSPLEFIKLPYQRRNVDAL